MQDLKCPICGSELTLFFVAGHCQTYCGSHFRCDGEYHRRKKFHQYAIDYLQEHKDYDANQDNGRQLHLNVTTRIYNEFKGITI